MQPVMIEVVGAEKLAAPGTPTPLWFRTRVKRDGHFLKATTYLVVDGSPRVFRARVDLRPIAKAVADKARAAGVKTNAREALVGAMEYNDEALVGGFNLFNPIKRKDKSKRTGGIFGKRGAIGGVVHKVGRIKLVRKVTGTLKKVGKVASKIALSKGFRGVLAGASAALAATGIGAPAAAALAAANVGLNAIAAGRTVAKGVDDLVKNPTRKTLNLGKVRANFSAEFQSRFAIRFFIAARK